MPTLDQELSTEDLGVSSLLDKYQRERSVQDEVAYSREALSQKIDNLYPRPPEPSTPADPTEKGLAPPIPDVPEPQGSEITDLIPVSPDSEILGPSISQSSPTQETPEPQGDSFLMGSLKFLEWAAGPLISFGDAAIAPIGADYDPNETTAERLGSVFKVSGEAFIKRFFPEYGQEVPFYGRRVVDRYMSGLPEAAKVPVGVALEMISDPSIMPGLPTLKMFQAGTRAQQFTQTRGMGVWELGLKDLMGTINTSQLGPAAPSTIRAATRVVDQERRSFFKDLTGKEDVKEVKPGAASNAPGEPIPIDTSTPIGDVPKSGEIVESTGEAIEKTTEGNPIKDFFGPQNRRTFMKRTAQVGAAAAVLAHPFKIAMEAATPSAVAPVVKAAIKSLRTVDPLVASQKLWAELVHLDVMQWDPEQLGEIAGRGDIIKNIDLMDRIPSVELMKDEQIFTNLHKVYVDEEITKLSFDEWAAGVIKEADRKAKAGEFALDTTRFSPDPQPHLSSKMSDVLEQATREGWDEFSIRANEAWDIYDADVIDNAVRLDFETGRHLSDIGKRYGITDDIEMKRFTDLYMDSTMGDPIQYTDPRMERLTKLAHEFNQDTKKHTWMTMDNPDVPESWRSALFRLSDTDNNASRFDIAGLGNPAAWRVEMAERLKELKMGPEKYDKFGKLFFRSPFDLNDVEVTLSNGLTKFESGGKLSQKQIDQEIKAFEEILSLPDEKFVDLYADVLTHGVKYSADQIDGILRVAAREMISGNQNPARKYTELSSELIQFMKKGKFGDDPKGLSQYMDYTALNQIEDVLTTLGRMTEVGPLVTDLVKEGKTMVRNPAHVDTNRGAFFDFQTHEVSKFLDKKPNSISKFLEAPREFFKPNTLKEYAETYYQNLISDEYRILRSNEQQLKDFDELVNTTPSNFNISRRHNLIKEMERTSRETKIRNRAERNLDDVITPIEPRNHPHRKPQAFDQKFKQRGAVQLPFGAKTPKELSARTKALQGLAKQADRGDLNALKQLDAELDNADGASMAATKNARDIVRKMDEVKQALGARDEVYKGTAKVSKHPQSPLIFRSSKTVAERVAGTPNASQQVIAIQKASIVDNAVNVEFQPNYMNIETLDDVDTMMNSYIDTYADQAEFLFGGRPGALEEQHRLLTDLLGDQKIKADPNAGPEVLYAHRQALLDSAERIRKLATDTQPEGTASQLTKATGDIREYALAKEIYMHKIMRERMLGIQPKSSADALHTLNIAHETPVGQFRELQRVFPMIEDSARIQRLFKAIAKESDPKTVSALAADMFKANFADVAHELFINNILSSLKTHAINIASNFSQMAVPPAQKTLEAMNATARGNFNKAGDDFAEASVMIQTTVESFGDFTKLLFTRNGFQNVDMPAELTRLHEIARIRHHPAVSSEALNYNGLWAPALDWLGKMIRVPGASLLREDVAAKLIQYRTSVNSQAIRRARKQGNGAADVKALYEIYRNHPTERMSTGGINQANILTFTNDLGSKGRILQNIKRTIPGARYVIPFIQTPTNIVKFGVRHSIFGNVFIDLKPALSRLDATGDAARAKIVMGSIIPGYLIGSMGEDITGQIDLHDPLGQLTTQTGAKPPYSIKINGEWISYQGIEPLRTVLGLMVSYRDTIQALDWSDEDFMGYFEGNQTLEEFAGNSADMLSHLAITAAAPFIRVIGDNYLLPQVGSLFYAIDAIRASNDATIPTEDREHWKSYVMRYLQRFASLTATVPGANLSKSLVQSGGISETLGFYDPGFKNAENYFDMVKAQLPYFSKDVANHINLYGDVQALPEGFGPDIISPFYVRPEAKDQVDINMAKLQPIIPRPKKKLGGVRMTPHEQEEYGIMVGKGFAGLGDIKEDIRSTMQSVYYNQISDEGKRAFIENLIHARRQAAEGYFIGTNIEFRKRVIARQQREAQKMRPIQ